MKLKNTITQGAILLFLMALNSCQYNFIEPDMGKPIDPEEPISFSTEIEPIFTARNCTNCHNGAGLFSLKTTEAYNSISSRSLVDIENSASSKILSVPGSTGTHSNWNYEGNQSLKIKTWIEQGAKDN